MKAKLPGTAYDSQKPIFGGDIRVFAIPNCLGMEKYNISIETNERHYPRPTNKPKITGKKPEKKVVKTNRSIR